MVELELGTLNELLKGELSAVASYDKALELVEENKTAEVLEQCRSSHAERVDKLRTAISESGGEPIEEGGPWGSLATMMTGTAASVGGDTALLTVLEEGEDLG
ncbi:MAG: PA2169 family four-helix-bundle protein, partial [Cyanobacteria bacterium]|nr:PA2169 family four-helix-bundle protein [Cyanobacteriota bacterium]